MFAFGRYKVFADYRSQFERLVNMNFKLTLLLSLILIFSYASCSQEKTNSKNDESLLKKAKYQQWVKINRCPDGIDAMSGKPVKDVSCKSEIFTEWKRVQIKAPNYVEQIIWVRFSNLIDEKILLVPEDKKAIRQGAWKNPKGPRLVFLQFDGMTDEFIQKGLANGELPAIEILMERGSAGSIRSCCDLISPSIWTTVLTGLKPEQHGIADFLSTDTNTGQIVENNSSDVKAPRLWEIAKAFNKKTLVSNAFYLDNEDNACERFHIQTDCAKHLRNLVLQTQPELLILYENTADLNSHLWWSVVEPKVFREKGWRISKEFIKFHSGRIEQSYRVLDAWTAFALSIAGPNTIILAHSDHGLGPFIGPPQWSIIISSLMEAMAFPGFFECGQASLEDIRFCHQKGADFKGFIKACQNARLTGGKRPFTEVEYVNPANGFSGFVRVKYDLVSLSASIENNEVLTFNGRSFPVRKLFMTSNSGDHVERGVIFIAGNGIKKGADFSKASVFDSMSNTLAILGLPIAEEMTGRLWEEMYDPPLKTKKIKSYGRLEKKKKYQLPSTEQLDSLRSLGYIQ